MKPGRPGRASAAVDAGAAGLGLCEHPGDGRPESEQPGRRQQDEPSFHRVHARSLSAYAYTSAPARAGSSHRFPNSRPETASCGNGGRADYRRIVGRPQCARPCGQPHSGPSHVTLPPPARGQVRRSGLGRLSPGPINFPKPRGFPAGLFFWCARSLLCPATMTMIRIAAAALALVVASSAACHATDRSQCGKRGQPLCGRRLAARPPQRRGLSRWSGPPFPTGACPDH